jgi:ornithine carbamoyltransferase
MGGFATKHEEVVAMAGLRGRHYLHLQDFTREELSLILETTQGLKLEAKRGLFQPLLRGKALGMVFDQPSTRTRISFEIGIQQLGGYALYMRPGELHLGKKETISDTARVMSRYLDGLMIRWNNFREIKEFAEHANIPVINGMSDINHPVQALADVFTMMERFGDVRGLKVSFFGDRTNVANSLALICSKLGLNYTHCAPKPYWILPEWTTLIEENCKASGGTFSQTEKIDEATQECQVVYTDVWWWIGQEHEEAERKKAFAPYRVTADILNKCEKDVIFEHCLPAARGVEVTDEVMDGPHSAIFDQAENRLHTEKALMTLVMG